MKMSHPYYPIIYIRGFAATMSEIESTVATPYMGFNLGSTKLRQDYKGKILRHIFESPLIRLMKDEGYIDTYQGGDFFSETQAVPAKSVWVYRYYEPMSEQLGTGERHDIPQAAIGLREFILRIKRQVCGDDVAEQNNYKVYLVAHSMGGLVARCYLQNLCVNGTGEVPRDQALGLPGDSMVDKVFTYGTPHNGIETVGINVPNLGDFDPLYVKNFNRKVMRQYLALPNDDNDDVNRLNDSFPTDKFFCFVGTNSSDYSEFFNLSKHAAGVMSDGLVMIKNATVDGAPRAFAHRSHSGQFGMVNSEEGYQNLRRFLFGQVRVDVKLIIDEITLPKQVQKAKDEGKQIRGSYNIETRAGVRNASYFLHERSVNQNSAILRSYDSMIKDKKPVYLFTGFLMKKARAMNATDSALAFAIRLGIQVPLYEVDNAFWFDDHFEGGYLFDDTVTIHVRPSKDVTSISYGLASVSGLGQAGRRLEAMPVGANDAEEYLIPLGFKKGAANPPRPGFRGTLQITARPWNSW